jgi:hypothetical protein
VEENYFSIDYDYIVENLIKNGFYILYDKKYTLKFKKDEINEKFNFDLTLPTHRNLIIKMN